MIKAHTTLCPVCGREFRAYPSWVKRKSRVYCSPRCRKKAVEQRRREHYSLYTCPVCKKKFEGYDIRKPKYCSVECYHKAIENIVTKTCRNCGKKFSGKHKLLRNRKYCSRACYHEHRRKKLKKGRG